MISKSTAAAILTELYSKLSSEDYLHMVHFVNSFVEDETTLLERKEKILRKLNLKKLINMVMGSLKGAVHDHPGIVDEMYYPSLGKRIGKTIYAEIEKVINGFPLEDK